MLVGQLAVVVGAYDEALIVLMHVCKQLVLIALPIHDMHDRAVIKLLLARLNTANPALGLTPLPARNVATAEVLLATASARAFVTAQRLHVQHAQRTTMPRRIHDKADMSEETRFTRGQVPDLPGIGMLEATDRRVVQDQHLWALLRTRKRLLAMGLKDVIEIEPVVVEQAIRPLECNRVFHGVRKAKPRMLGQLRHHLQQPLRAARVAEVGTLELLQNPLNRRFVEFHDSG